MEDAKPHLNPIEVFQTLQNVNANDVNVRKPAELKLQEWESSSAPGFLSSLLEIVQRRGEVPDEIRLLACIVGKNTVGSSWRKTVGTREWSHVPVPEKQLIRNMLPELLFKEPSDKIALQLALFLANIARFDFPRDWPNVLDILVSAVTTSSANETKYRAVIGLKYVFQRLQTKVTLTSGFNFEAVQSAVKEAQEMPQRVAAQFVPLAGECKKQLQEFARAGPQWEAHAILATEFIIVLENCLRLMPTLESAEAGVRMFFETLLECSRAQLSLLISKFEPQHGKYYQLIAKAFFRAINCVTASLEKHTLEFSAYLVPFFAHYAEVLVRFPRSSAFFIPRKLMKVSKFLRMVLICPFFRDQFWKSFLSIPERQQKFDATKQAFHDLNQFLTLERLGPILDSLMRNYLCLTQEEIECWQYDPESWLKESDNTDSPRSWAEEVLVALYFRNPEEIKQLLTQYVAQLQSMPFSLETGLLLDSCYKAIGIAKTFKHQIVDINQWYEAELRGRIFNSEHAVQFIDRVLLNRSIWLVRQFSTLIAHEHSQRLIDGLLQTIAKNPDLVVNMQAILALHGIISKLSSSGPTVLSRAFGLIPLQNESDPHQNSLAAEELARKTFHENLPIGEIIGQCFHLLAKLKETDNRVHILDLVSQLIRMVGYSVIQPHLEKIVNYLPALWTDLPKPNEDQESGGEVRLQKSIVALTSSLIQAIGPCALENPRVGELALAILQFTTNPVGQQALNMLDEGLQLWSSIMTAAPGLSPVLLELFPRLFQILLPSAEPLKALPILEQYVVLGGPAHMRDFAPQLVGGLDKIISRCDSKESILAANIIYLLIQIFPTDAPKWFFDTLHRITRDLVDGLSQARINPENKDLIPAEAMAFSKIIARIVVQDPGAFSVLCANNVQAQQQLTDRWLQCLCVRSIEELFSTAASLNGLQERKLIAAALLVLMDNNNAVVCEHAAKSLPLISTVTKEVERMSERIARFRELQMKSQPDRQLEINYRDLKLNDPVATLDISPLFARVLSKLPISEEDLGPHVIDNLHLLTSDML